MKQFILFLSLLVGSAYTAFSQQETQFSQSFTNPYFFNPAAGGMTNVGEVYLSERSQWSGVEGRPTTFYGTIASQIDINRGDDVHPLQEFNKNRKSFYSSPLRTLGKKHVVGGRFYTDQIGPFRKTSFQGSYAIHIPISKTFNMGAGLGVGMSNFGVDASSVSLASGGDAVYYSYLSGTSRQNYFDANAGLVFYSSKFLLSLSTSQLLNNTAEFDKVSSDSKYIRHYFGMISYDFPVGPKSEYEESESKPSHSIEPFAIAKITPNTPLSYDLGMRFHYSRIGFLSLSYRSQSALAIGIGCNVFENFRFCYNYDIGTGATRNFGMGAHEIQLGFIFGHKRNLEKEFRKDEQEKRRKKQAEEDI